MSRDTRAPITPKTKVAELLDAYPELEQVLVDMAPLFRKLKNPVLRRTIARVTTLERAAGVADLPLRELTTALRRAAGFPDDDGGLDAGGPAEISDGDEPAPWVDASRVRWTVDADELLAAGKEPITDVVEKARLLGVENLGLIRSSFRPAPLIELLEKQGFRIAVVRSDDGFATFVGRDGGSPPPVADGSSLQHLTHVDRALPETVRQRWKPTSPTVSARNRSRPLRRGSGTH
jgi:hypothetical protein